MPGAREPNLLRDLSAVPLPRSSYCDLQSITTFRPCVRILPLAPRGRVFDATIGRSESICRLNDGRDHDIGRDAA